MLILLSMPRLTSWTDPFRYSSARAYKIGVLIRARKPLAQFDMFLKNSLGVLFFLFFLFQLAMSGLAFLVSTAVSKASTGTNLGFAIFLVGWIMQVSIKSDLACAS